MILSDRDLRTELAAGRIIIEPFDESCVQPSSIDIKVHHLFRVFRNHTAGIIDVKKDMTDLTELVDIPLDGVFILHPGEFVLGSTLERVAVPNDLVARVEGKAHLVALAYLFIPPLVLLMLALMATSHWNWQTWPTFPSRCTQA